MLNQKWKKKLQYVIFLFQFKLGCKAAETPHNINQVFGIGTTTERTAQWWFKKFMPVMKVLKMMNIVVDHQMLTMINKES